MTLLVLESVTKRYGAVTAVDGVSFAIDRGEEFLVLGQQAFGFLFGGGERVDLAQDDRVGLFELLLEDVADGRG